MILCNKHRIHWGYYFNKKIPSVINFQNVSGYIQGLFKKKINCRAMPDTAHSDSLGTRGYSWGEG